MAEASAPDPDSAVDEEFPDKSLQEIFLDGWKLYEELEGTPLSTNSSEFQEKVKSAMKHLETSTRIVSEIGMFSPNEFIDEVSTESLQYLLLPFLLGKLALKLNREDRAEVLNVAEVYIKDYLQRCQEYDLCENAQNGTSTVANSNGAHNEMAELMRAAQARNDKIAQFRRKKELEDEIKLLKAAVLNRTCDEELKRDFFMKFLKKSIIDAKEELESLKMERQMVEMRRMHMSGGGGEATHEFDDGGTAFNHVATRPHGHDAGPSHDHGHSHHHHHHHHHHGHTRQTPRPLQPFIITRDATQRAVFGAGYPSLPVMTVNEFYEQRVRDGVFPDEEKVARMNEAQAVAAAQDPNEKEDEEKAVVEEQVENDDPEYLERMRRMDEYKDVVRRGDGNRYNRS